MRGCSRIAWGSAWLLVAAGCFSSNTGDHAPNGEPVVDASAPADPADPPLPGDDSSKEPVDTVDPEAGDPPRGPMCPVGSRDCACTEGGGCDPLLECADGRCRATGATCAPRDERCNGADDDCDGIVDEGGPSICETETPGAVAECVELSAGPVCVVRECRPGFTNCDGLIENGCEPLCDCGDCGDAGTPPVGCPDAIESSPAELHAAAAAAIAVEVPCGFASCHTGSGRAGLVLHGAPDLRALLVDVPACENPDMPRVDPRGGEAALDNSWLWIKLTGPFDPAIGTLVPDPSWAAPGACGQTPGSYGVHMPNGTLLLLDDERLEAVRAWICAGAPGP